MAVSPGREARPHDVVVAQADRDRVQARGAVSAASFLRALFVSYAARWRRTTGRCFLPARHSTSILRRTPGWPFTSVTGVAQGELRGHRARGSNRGCRFLPEHRHAHDATRVVVEHHADPPAERPALEQREGRPRGPEAGPDGHGGQVHEPYVVGVLRRDGALLSNRLGVCRLRSRRLLEDTPHRGRAQVQAGPRQDLRDLHLAEHGTQGFEPLDDVPHEVGELVDRLVQPNKHVGAAFSSPRRGATFSGREMIPRSGLQHSGAGTCAVGTTHPIVCQVLTAAHLRSRLALVMLGRGGRGCAPACRRAPSTSGPAATEAMAGPCLGGGGSLGEAPLWVGARRRLRLQAIAWQGDRSG